MRIASLLPAATEIVCALGAGSELVAVSHECDFPVEVQGKPVVSRTRFDPAALSSLEIDRLVAQTIQNGESLYLIDRKVLAETKPDLILTQALCDVCAVTGETLQGTLESLNFTPEILELSPTNLEGIFDNIKEVGSRIDRTPEADALSQELRGRLANVSSWVRQLPHRLKVFCLEWLDPPYATGHWVPEMVGLAGGVEIFDRKGRPSVRVTWDEVAACRPEVVVVMPCGFSEARARQELVQLSKLPQWQSLPAVQQNRIYFADANSYFSRPGPRVVEGVEMLAQMLFLSCQGEASLCR